MESSEKTETPRRSMRIQRQRAVTPDVQILGPRELMKMNKSRSKIDFDQSSSSKNLPEINIIPATPIIAAKKRRNTHSSIVSKKSMVKDDIKEINKPVEIEKKDEKKESPEKSQDTAEERNIETKVDRNDIKEIIKPVEIENEDEKKEYPEKSQDTVEERNVEAKVDMNDVKKSIIQEQTIQSPTETKVDMNDAKKSTIQEQTIQSPTETEEFHSAITENIEDESCDKTVEVPIKDKNDTYDKGENEVDKQIAVIESKQDEEPDKTVEVPIKDKNDTYDKGEIEVDKQIAVIASKQDEEPDIKNLDQESQLMDESIISVPESPSMISTVVKDSTFSPEVDTSIRDSRPHIDNVMTPIIPRNVTLRTSTPLSQRVLMRDTPRLSGPVISALKKVLSPKVGENKKLNEESLNETFSDQIKMGNPLEKSILKSSRRKRSLSVADGESFMQKKVNFVSPQIMNIDTIDEKMLQSFKEEKENSMIRQALVSGGGMRRKRSMSETVTPSKAKIKVPNFKAIHEQQFKKMESIVDHAQRKAERAKRLATPSKISSLPKIKEAALENNSASKIPIRKPLTKVSSSENILHGIKARTIKRSNSAETHSKHAIGSKIPTVKETENKVGSGKKIILPRILDKNTKAPTVSKFTAIKNPSVSTSFPKAESSVQSMRNKVEERRERNMSLYKGNSVKTGLDHRKKNDNAIKGVRLNRRFELQMQHRRMEEANED